MPVGPRGAPPPPPPMAAAAAPAAELRPGSLLQLSLFASSVRGAAGAPTSGERDCRGLLPVCRRFLTIQVPLRMGLGASEGGMHGPPASRRWRQLLPHHRQQSVSLPLPLLFELYCFRHSLHDER